MGLAVWAELDAGCSCDLPAPCGAVRGAPGRPRSGHGRRGASTTYTIHNQPASAFGFRLVCPPYPQTAKRGPACITMQVNRPKLKDAWHEGSQASTYLLGTSTIQAFTPLLAPCDAGVAASLPLAAVPCWEPLDDWSSSLPPLPSMELALELVLASPWPASSFSLWLPGLPAGAWPGAAALDGGGAAAAAALRLMGGLLRTLTLPAAASVVLLLACGLLT